MIVKIITLLLSMNSDYFECPFCGSHGPLTLMGADRFPVLKNLQVIGAGRRAARCPICASTDKERLVYAFLNYIERLNSKTDISILHIAPERNLQRWLVTISNKYIAGDAFLQNQEFAGNVRYVDICHTDFSDLEFDYVICNHVICDIKNASVALNEIYRILKHGGTAIVQVPITKISTTVEYPDVKTKEDREKAYGYGYHERIYNNEEYKKLLISAGFNVDVCNISDRFNTMGLNSQEDLYICRKVDL